MSLFGGKGKRQEKFSSPKQMTPAAHAEAAWDRREGQIVVRNANLRKIIVVMGIGIIALSVGLTIQSTKSSVEPYVVVVNDITGEVKNVASLKNAGAQYTPQDAEYKYFLSRFIRKTREVPLDPVVFKDQWNEAYAFLTKDAAAKMNAQIKQEKLADKFGHKTVQIQIVSCLPMEGSNSYQVRWNEEEFTIGSGDKVVTPMSGIFTTTTIPPKDEKALLVNPLGIYVSDFNWSKDATAQVKK